MIKGSWYNRVYLCWEDTNYARPSTHTPIKGFNCYKYGSFQEADNVWHNNLHEYKDMNVRCQIIPVCKWIPSIFDEYIIKRSLRKIYWLEHHSFGNGIGIGNT